MEDDEKDDEMVEMVTSVVPEIYGASHNDTISNCYLDVPEPIGRDELEHLLKVQRFVSRG